MSFLKYVSFLILFASSAYAYVPMKSANTANTGALRDASGNFSAGTITAALTGAASSNVLKAGDTMTGALVNSFAGAASTPGILVSGAPFTGGSATTTKPQLNVDSAATSNNWSTSGTGIGVNAPSGFAGNLIDAQVNGVAKFKVGSDGQTTFTNSTETVLMGMSSSTRFTINNNAHANSTFLNFATNTGYIGLGIGTFSNDWLIGITQSSTDTAPLTNLIPNTGTYPILVIRNSSATANNYGALGFSGSTDKLTSFIYGVTTVHTASSETGDLHFGTNNAGTKIDDMIIRSKGMVTFVGSAPTIGTCGTSPSMVAGGSDNYFKVNGGTGGISGTCAVTLTQTPTTGGMCQCRDKTTVTTVVDADIATNVVTLTTYGRTTGVALNFAASDVFECLCHFN